MHIRRATNDAHCPLRAPHGFTLTSYWGFLPLVPFPLYTNLLNTAHT